MADVMPPSGFEPPQPPTPPEPPFAPPPAPPLLPWEDPAYPRLEALYETAKLVLFNPREAFSRMNPTVSLGKPILFAVILGWVAIIVGQIYQWAFRSTLASLMPGMFARQDMFFSKVASVIAVITAPVWVLFGLGLATLVIHLFLLLFGGAQRGFETTLRTLAYSEATYVFEVIPLVGGLIAILWWFFVSIVGLAQAHGTTTGRAAGAVLTPVLLCCVCVVAVLVMAGAAIFGALQHLR